jgi:archaellum biogenesis ATPase FlaH
MEPIAEWFKEERGIDYNSIQKWYVEPVVGDRLACQFATQKIKYLDGQEPRFGFPKGTKASLLFGPSDSQAQSAFLTEGETDAMRLDQELRDHELIAQVVALPGVASWQDAWAAKFDKYKRVFVVLDNDTDYAVRATVDKQWLKIKRALGNKAVRVTLPDNVKDVCEFFEAFEWQVFQDLIDESLVSTQYTALNLNDEPIPTDWLIDGMIAKGDLHLIMGDPGAGKSWLTMSIAVQAAKGQAWAGRKIDRPLRVLYVDEENPESVIYERLVELGYDDLAAPNIRYLSRQGIRLDGEADKLIEDAQLYEPDLIVLDSLNRIHTLEENSAGDMARLFNDGIKLLAQATGAAVILIHHTNKSDGSGYRRSRGSGDIVAAVDTAFDVRRDKSPSGQHLVSVFPFKARRGETRKSLVRWHREQGRASFESVHTPTEDSVI